MTSALFAVAYILAVSAVLATVLWLCLSLLRLVRGEAPFVPVMDHALDAIVSELALDGSSVFVELGCGDGKVLIAASKKFPGTKMIGLEKSLVPFLLAKWNTRHLTNIEILREDIFKYDVSQATHVYTYLFPAVMDQLYPKLETHLMAGTILISCDFTFSKKPPVRSVDIATASGKFLARRIHVYRF